MIQHDFRLILRPDDRPPAADPQREAIGLRDEIRCLRAQSDSLTQMLAHPSPSLDAARLFSSAHAAALALAETVTRVEGRAEATSQAVRGAPRGVA